MESFEDAYTGFDVSASRGITSWLHRMPIHALRGGAGENGVALWHLTVHGVALPGRWSIMDRRFIPQFKSATDPDPA